MCEISSNDKKGGRTGFSIITIVFGVEKRDCASKEIQNALYPHVLSHFSLSKTSSLRLPPLSHPRSSKSNSRRKKKKIDDQIPGVASHHTWVYQNLPTRSAPKACVFHAREKESPQVRTCAGKIKSVAGFCAGWTRDKESPQLQTCAGNIKSVVG